MLSAAFGRPISCAPSLAKNERPAGRSKEEKRQRAWGSPGSEGVLDADLKAVLIARARVGRVAEGGLETLGDTRHAQATLGGGVGVRRVEAGAPRQHVVVAQRPLRGLGVARREADENAAAKAGGNAGN